MTEGREPPYSPASRWGAVAALDWAGGRVRVRSDRYIPAVTRSLPGAIAARTPRARPARSQPPLR